MKVLITPRVSAANFDMRWTTLIAREITYLQALGIIKNVDLCVIDALVELNPSLNWIKCLPLICKSCMIILFSGDSGDFLSRYKRQTATGDETKKEESFESELCKDKDAGEWFRLVTGEGDNCRDVIQCTSSVSDIHTFMYSSPSSPTPTSHWSTGHFFDIFTLFLISYFKVITFSLRPDNSVGLARIYSIYII